MQKVILVILDGWGWSPIGHGNLLAETDTPGLDTLLGLGRGTLLKTASLEVGLPWGSVGDSELGHYNLGTGRIVLAYPGKKAPTLIEILKREQALLDEAIIEQQQPEQIRSQLIIPSDNLPSSQTGRNRQTASATITPASPSQPSGLSSQSGNERISRRDYELASIKHPAALRAPVSLGGLLGAYGLNQVKVGPIAKWGVLTAAMNGYPTEPVIGEEFLGLEAHEDLARHIHESAKLQAADFVVVNLADADQAAHRGEIVAVQAAIKQIDKQLQAIYRWASQRRAVLYLVGDHGNIEQMLTEHDRVITDHTTAPVLFARIDCRSDRQVAWATHARRKQQIALSAPTGLLADVAPTLLEEFHLTPPETMVGISLRKMLLKG